jgi:hypothetical protein
MTLKSTSSMEVQSNVQTNKIEVSKDGAGKTLYIPLGVYRSGNSGLTIACSDPIHSFKFGTSVEQLQKFKDRLEELFSQLIEPKNSK